MKIWGRGLTYSYSSMRGATRIQSLQEMSQLWAILLETWTNEVWLLKSLRYQSEWKCSQRPISVQCRYHDKVLKIKNMIDMVGMDKLYLWSSYAHDRHGGHGPTVLRSSYTPDHHGGHGYRGLAIQEPQWFMRQDNIPWDKNVRLILSGTYRIINNDMFHYSLS